jgi:uncharacterized protein
MTRLHEPNNLCWIDLGTPDPNAAAEFYRTVFGWDPEPADDSGYRLCRLNGALVAALGPSEDRGTPYWTTYVSVADAHDTLSRVESAGGETVVGPYEVAHVGTFAVMADSCETHVQVWQPSALSGVETSVSSGAWIASHLVTDEVDRSTKFYGDVFGWMSRGHQLHLGESFIASVGPIDRELVGDRRSQWVTVFGTNDLAVAGAALGSAGGHVLGDTVLADVVTTIAVDDQGTVFGLQLI